MTFKLKPTHYQKPTRPRIACPTCCGTGRYRGEKCPTCGGKRALVLKVRS